MNPVECWRTWGTKVWCTSSAFRRWTWTWSSSFQRHAQWQHVPWNDGHWSAGLPHPAPTAYREWWGGVDVGGTGTPCLHGWSTAQNCLKDDGGEQFPVLTAVTIRAAWWLDPDMAAVDHFSSFWKSSVSCQPYKPTSYQAKPPGLQRSLESGWPCGEWPPPPQ